MTWEDNRERSRLNPEYHRIRIKTYLTLEGNKRKIRNPQNISCKISKIFPTHVPSSMTVFELSENFPQWIPCANTHRILPLGTSGYEFSSQENLGVHNST